MALLVYLALICISASGKGSLGAEETWIQSPRITNQGEWGNEEKCPAGQYATGFSLKDEASVGTGDDSALNGIKLFCNIPGNTLDTNTITSRVGSYGAYGNNYLCTNGMFIGFQLRVEAFTENNDNTAGNNLRMLCSNSDLGWIQGDGNSWGDWTAEEKCPSSQGICGIRTQVDDVVVNHDDTGLNNVDMLCCSTASPASTCTPQDAWQEIITCTNNAFLRQTKCRYSYKVGVRYSPTAASRLTLVDELQALETNFESTGAWTQVTTHDWRSATTNSWSEEKTVSTDFEVPPKRKVVVSQVVGKCGDFDAFTGDFKLDVYNLFGRRLSSKTLFGFNLNFGLGINWAF